MSEASDAVREAELERCRAVNEGDWPALERVLSDELTHTHMNGRVDDKRAVTENFQAHPRTITRGPLKVRMYGEIALMNGRQFLDFGERVAENEALQVWRLVEGAWVLLAFQASAVPPASA